MRATRQCISVATLVDRAGRGRIIGTAFCTPERQSINTGDPMKASHGLLAGFGGSLSLALPAAHAQDIQERTIRFGHLNNPDHPVSAGGEKFGRARSAKSGGRM